MTPRLLYDLMSVLQLLHTGRTHVAAEALATVIRENGGRVPTAPVIAFPKPEPAEKPVWMRPGA